MQAETIIQTDSILAKLKAETAHQHQQTEDNVDLMRSDFSLDDYKNLLTKFYAFYQPFEAQMTQAIKEHSVDFNYAERLNTPKLTADLQSLGMSLNQIEQIKPCENLPVLDSKERIFGALYVIEGSTLGGQIISRHLKEKFNLDETNGFAFFSGYGKETGRMWNAFRESITASAADHTNHDEIIKSANETFDKIGNCLK